MKQASSNDELAILPNFGAMKSEPQNFLALSLHNEKAKEKSTRHMYQTIVAPAPIENTELFEVHRFTVMVCTKW